MSYVIYNKETTLILGGYRQRYATEQAAKGALTKAVNAGNVENKDDFAIADKSDFHESIEKQVTRVNMMSGNEYKEPANTPVHCSPAYESYWSM